MSKRQLEITHCDHIQMLSNNQQWAVEMSCMSVMLCLIVNLTIHRVHYPFESKPATLILPDSIILFCGLQMYSNQWMRKDQIECILFPLFQQWGLHNLQLPNSYKKKNCSFQYIINLREDVAWFVFLTFCVVWRNIKSFKELSFISI